MIEVKDGDDTTNKVFSKFLKDSYDSVKWQPNELPEGETEESQKALRLWLITKFGKIKNERDINTLKTNMA